MGSCCNPRRCRRKRRQRGDFLFVNVQTHLATCSLEKGRRRGDLDGLRRLAEFELYVDSGSIPQAQGNAGLLKGAEARLLHRERVLTRWQSDDVVRAAFIRVGGVVHQGRLVFRLDFGFRHCQPGGISYRAK